MTLRELVNCTNINDFNNDYSLPNWFNSIIDKEISDLNDFDISRLIRQRFLESQILEEATKRFFKNPLIGTYDGELLKQFSYLDKLCWEQNIEITKKMYDYVQSLDINQLDWLDEDDKIDFVKNIERLKSLINEIY